MSSHLKWTLERVMENPAVAMCQTESETGLKRQRFFFFTANGSFPQETSFMEAFMETRGDLTIDLHMCSYYENL